jgi:o-succinylbenzoate synthase
MRIARASLHEVSGMLVAPFRASSHASQELRHVLVRLEDAQGAVGWGEAATLRDPFYLPETSETAWHVLRDFLVPLVLGRPWQTIEELAALYGAVKGNSVAKCGLEIAAWDLLGRSQGRSVASLVGGTREEIHAGIALGIEPDSGRLLERIQDAVDRGYRRVKLKVAPGMDVAVLEAVRARFPDLPLMVDANGAYSLAQRDHLRLFDSFGLTMIEEPLASGDLFEHAELQRALHTPICLDESLPSAAATRRALELGSCRVVNLKPARMGGLLEAARAHDVCVARGIPVWCGGMLEFGIGRAASVALASLPGFSLPGDIAGSDRYFDEDIVDPPIVAQGGAIQVPLSRPGLGHEPLLERIARRTLRSHEATA